MENIDKRTKIYKDSIKPVTPIEIIKPIEIKSPEFRVYDKRGGYVRTYSKEMHGDNFVKMAEGFIKKNKYRGFNRGIILG